MEESYFAFVSSGRKVQPNAKIDAVLKELSPTDGKGERKIRSRVGITGASGAVAGLASGPGSRPSSSGPSLPSVPSLPSITLPGSGPGSGVGTPAFGQIGTSPGSRPGTGAGLAPGATPSLVGLDIGVSTRLDTPSSGKPKLAMILVVALLLVAVALLAYVVLFGQSKPKVKVHEMPQTRLELVQPPRG